MFDDRTPEQLRAELAAFNKPQEANTESLTPGASADELRVEFILRKRADQVTADDRLFLARNIAIWEANRNA
jgi:hypothetical protein